MLRDEINIDGELIAFQKWWLLDEQVTMLIPDGFLAMSKKQILLHYPHDQQPHTVICNYKDAYLQLYYDVEKLNMAHSVDETLSTIKYRSDCKILAKGNYPSELGEIEFLNYILASDFSLMWTLRINRKKMMAFASAPADDSKSAYWQAVFWRILSSIQKA